MPTHDRSDGIDPPSPHKPHKPQPPAAADRFAVPPAPDRRADRRPDAPPTGADPANSRGKLAWICMLTVLGKW